MLRADNKARYMASLLDTIRLVFGTAPQCEQPKLNWERLQIGLKEGAMLNPRVSHRLKNSAFEALSHNQPTVSS